MVAQTSSALGPGTDPVPATLRCFVALWPDAEARERLDALAREQQARFASARRTRRENLHLTLAFIGALPVAQAKQVAAQLARLPAADFDWPVDQLGTFAGSGVLWAGGESAPLRQLAARLRQLLDELAIAYDRKPFAPHVTLLRRLPRQAATQAAVPILPPIRWRAGAPRLLQSTRDAHGIRYRELAAGRD